MLSVSQITHKKLNGKNDPSKETTGQPQGQVVLAAQVPPTSDAAAYMPRTTHLEFLSV